jgi:hypothetical protein
MVRRTIFMDFFGPPKLFSMFYGPQAEKVWETLGHSDEV